VNNAIRRNHVGIGIKVDSNAERHLGITDNIAIGEVSEAQLDIMVEEVVSGGVKFMTTFCTNLRAAQRVTYRERKYGIVVFDTVAIVVWDMLRTVGEEMSLLKRWVGSSLNPFHH
jgi:maleate isomerase